MNVEEARDARKKGVVAFTKFCDNGKQHPSKLFCFFEGNDRYYYCPRIENILEISYSKIISYDCNGKYEVLRAHRLIKQNMDFNHIKKAFFIDRDYITLNNLDDDIYQTPCYSIENFYCSIESFKKIINREFNLSVIEDDFQKCCKDFEARQNEFHNETELLNAWLLCNRKIELSTGNNRIDLRNFKISKLFTTISIDTVLCRNEINLALIDTFFKKANFITTDQLDETLEDFKKQPSYSIFRGKFEIVFLKKIITDLRQKTKSGTYFSEKQPNIKIDPNINPLSSLSQYADTPDCLKSFLLQYKSS